MAKFTVNDLDVRGKRRLRVDYNVPMEEKDGRDGHQRCHPHQGNPADVWNCSSTRARKSSWPPIWPSQGPTRALHVARPWPPSWPTCSAATSLSWMIASARKSRKRRALKPGDISAGKCPLLQRGRSQRSGLFRKARQGRRHLRERRLRRRASRPCFDRRRRRVIAERGGKCAAADGTRTEISR